jgi:hypothetical protein
MGSGMPKPGWGAGLLGEPTDLEDWAYTLKEPFDPWVEVHGAETVLRSASFDDLPSASEVRDRAAALIERLNGAVAISQQARRLRLGGIIQFTPDGRLHRTIFAEMGAVEVRAKVRASATVIRADGKPVPSPPPQPSEVQKWTTVAENDDLLDDALIYFGRATDWFDIYKTLECLILRFGGGSENAFLALGWALDAEITRLKRTANSARHARRKFNPPPYPMSLVDARSLLVVLLRRALKEAE